MAAIKEITSIRSILFRTAIFLLIWWILTDGATQSWWLGTPAVVLAVITSVLLLPPAPVIWVEFLRFVPFFLVRSLLGGIDVGWRAFHPRMPIDPDIIEYPLRLPQGLPRVVVVNTVSLLPGTLSAMLENDVMKVHVLDRQKAYLAEIEAVENNVARMFDIPLNTPRGK